MSILRLDIKTMKPIAVIDPDDGMSKEEEMKFWYNLFMDKHRRTGIFNAEKNSDDSISAGDSTAATRTC